MATTNESFTNSPFSAVVDSLGTGKTLTDVHGTLSHSKSPRALPPWIDPHKWSFGVPTEAQLKNLARRSPRERTTHHDNSPALPKRLKTRVSRDGYVDWDEESLPRASRRRTTKLRDRLRWRGDAECGRKWDHLRTAEPVIMSAYASANNAYKWRRFVRSSHYGLMPNEDAEVVDIEILDRLQPTFNHPIDVVPIVVWKRTNAECTNSRASKPYKRAWRMILEHPLVPLCFRLTVLLTSIIALALSSRLGRTEKEESTGGSSERAQAIVAIVVDSLAIPYIGYMTWDEYTGKPLGLRSAIQKSSLILMDLVFIILKAASTTLAFETLVYHNLKDHVVRQLSRALAAFQTVGLISWTSTFAVNVFRLVQRLGGGEDDRP